MVVNTEESHERFHVKYHTINRTCASACSASIAFIQGSHTQSLEISKITRFPEKVKRANFPMRFVIFDTWSLTMLVIRLYII